MKLSSWIVIDGYCATRVFEGTDPNKVENRVAFIEKTPRVRLPHIQTSVETRGEIGATGLEGNKSIWISGYGEDARVNSLNYALNENMCLRSKKYGECGFCPEARTWCDDMLELLGYELG